MTDTVTADNKSRAASLFARLKQKQGNSNTKTPAHTGLSRLGLSKAPLSSAQERLWFHYQLDSQSTLYNMPFAFELEGALDKDRLEGALALLVERHEALRTHFEGNNEQAFQCIEKTVDLPFYYEDLTAQGDEAEEQAQKRFIEQGLQQPFDLSVGPLFKVFLFQLSTTRAVVAMVIHHIITDGWSLQLLARDLLALYQADGKAAHLPALEVQYSDYAAWEKAQMNLPVWQQSMDYWQQQLHDAPALDFPSDKVRPQQPSHKGATVSLAIDAARQQAVVSFCHSRRITESAFYLAIYKIALGLFAGKQDISVAVSSANRDMAEVTSMVGFFANLMVVRSNWCSDDSIDAVVRNEQQQLLQAIDNQRVSYHHLVKQLCPGADRSQSALFQAHFLMNNQDVGQQQQNEMVAEQGMSAQRWGVGSEIALYDLSMSFAQHSDGLYALINYSTDLFSAATIESFAQLWQTVLDYSLEQSDLTVGQLMPDARVQETLLSWGQGVEVDEHKASLSIIDAFAAQVERDPQALALVYDDEQMSYGQLDTQANQLAHVLLERGAEPGDIIGICLPRRCELVVSLLAVLKVGGVYLPIDAQWPHERTELLIENSGLQLLISDEDTLDELPAHSINYIELVVWEEDEDEIAQAPEDSPEVAVEPTAPCYIMYTSGSTGTPKGVVACHQGVVRVCHQPDYIATGPEHVLLQAAPVIFDAATFEIWGALLNGARLVIYPAPRIEIATLFEVIEQHQVSTLWLTTVLFNSLVDLYPQLPQSLKQIIFGGEKASKRHVEMALEQYPQLKLYNAYGPTETTTFATIFAIDEAVNKHQEIPIGKPIAQTRCYVLNQALQLVAPGAIGELYIGGEGLAQGYLHQQELTDAAFIADPFGWDEQDKIYKTGDLVRWLPDGDLAYVGRVDSQVKLNGHRIELEAISHALARFDGVKQAFVTVKSMPQGERLVAYWVGEGQSQTLKSLLRSSLPSYMVPQLFVELAQLPLNTNGKVDVAALPLPQEQAEDSGPDMCDSDDVKLSALGRVAKQVLKVNRLSASDNFFECGGDSMSAIMLKAQLQKCGWDFEMDALFKLADFTALAGQLNAVSGEDVAGGIAPFALLNEADRQLLEQQFAGRFVDMYPLSHMQQGMLYHSYLNADSANYHDVITYQVKRAYSAELLTEVLQALVDKHEIFRTQFNLVAFSCPMQQVLAHYPVSIAVEDISHLDGRAQQQFLQRWLDKEKTKAYDWQGGPLWRAQLHTLSERSFQFSLSFHHAILDGWSEASLMTELVNRAEAKLAGQRYIDVPLKSHYRDFIAEEYKALSSDEHRQFWQQQMLGNKGVALPRLARAEGAERSVDQVEFDMPIAVSEQAFSALQSLAKKASVPLKTIFLAAHYKALSLLCDSDDVTATVVTNGRVSAQDGEKVLGLFLNTLPLRVKFVDCDWPALVKQVRQHEQDIYTHRYFPLAKINELAGGVDFSHVMFNYTDFHVLDDIGEMVEQSQVQRGGSTQTGIPLTCTFSIKGGELVASLRFSAAHYCRQSARLMVKCYSSVLQHMASHGDSAHSAVDTVMMPLLQDSRIACADVAPKQQWCQNVKAFDDAKSLPELIAQYAEAHGDQVAIVCSQQQLTFAQLQRRANAVAHRLLDDGIKPGEIVAIACGRQSELLVGILAVLKAGGAWLPIDAAQPNVRLQFMLDDAGADKVMTLASIAADLPLDGKQTYLLDELPTDAPEKAAPLVDVNLSQVAYVIYTSGSTGVPKGVKVSHQNLLNLAFGLAEILQDNGLTRPYRWAWNAASVFDASIQALSQLPFGASLYLPDGNVRQDPALFQAFVAQHHIEVIDCTPTMAASLLTQYKAQPQDLPNLLIGGEKISEHLWQALSNVYGEFGGFGLNLYGPTECTVDSSYGVIGEHDVSNIGRPLPNVQLHVRNEKGLAAKIGEVGELYISGKGVAIGYINREDLNAQAFIAPGQIEGIAERCYRTGDLVKWLPEGVLAYVGRNDAQIKLRGYRIEPDEIAYQLQQLPDVNEATVCLKTLPGGNEVLVAYACGERHRHHDWASELKADLGLQLPHYLLPDAVVTLARLPMTINGKVDIGALPLPEVIAATGAGDGPIGKTEQKLAQIWAKLFGCDIQAISRAANFFELGGHSLMLIRLIAEIAQAFECQLFVKDIFSTPTLKDLALRIDRQGKSALKVKIEALCSDDDSAPLSYAQRRVWFVQQLQPRSTQFHQVSNLAIDGKFNVDAAQKAFEALIARHQTLRTSYHSINGELQQQLLPSVAFDLKRHDLRAIEGEQRHIQTAQLLEQGAEQLFDLSADLMLRAQWLQLADNQGVLQFVLHHIATDGWSAGVLINDFGRLYQAALENRSALLEPIRLQYRDYALWQTSLLESNGQGSDAFKYWMGHLAGLPAHHAIPLDHARSGHGAGKAGRCPIAIDAQTGDGVKALAKETDSTVFMVLHAALCVLLARWSGESDIVLGTPVANRLDPQLDNLVGLFVNTLVLRVDCADNLSFSALLEQVKDVNIAAQSHQQVPFDLLVEQLNPVRGAHHPLFQVMLNMNNNQAPSSELADCSVAPLVSGETQAMYDLTFNIVEQPQGLVGSIEYDCALFDAQTIERMSQSLCALLAGMVRNIAQPVYDIQIEPQPKALEYCQAPATAHDSIAALFEANAQQFATQIAVEDGERQLSYQVLNCRANQLAHWLMQQGIDRNKPLGVCLSPGIEQVVAILAGQKAGVAMVPLDPKYPQSRLLHMVVDSGMSHVIADSSMQQTLGEVVLLDVMCPSNQTVINNMPTANLAVASAPETLAYLMYTSGSSGKPKGVLVSQQNWLAYRQGAMVSYDLAPGARVMQFAALSFDIYIEELTLSLLSGGTLVFKPQMQGTLSGEDFWQFVAQKRIDIATVPTAYWHVLCAEPRLAEFLRETTLHTLITGGEAMRCAALSNWQKAAGAADKAVRLFNTYGPTETCVVATALDVSLYHCDLSDVSAGYVAIGKALPGYELRIMDSHGQCVPDGVCGQLYIGGPAVAQGYLGLEQQTQAQFVELSDAQGQLKRFYRSGDLVRKCNDGRLVFIGRMDNQLKHRGFRIEPGEIEAHLTQLPALDSALVGLLGDRLVAWVKPQISAEVDARQIKAALAGRLAAYMVPDQVVLIDQWPLTAVGKIDKDKLPVPMLDVALDKLPDDSVSQQLAAIWAEVLRCPLEQISMNANFFDLGGHSLLSVSLVAQVANKMGVKLAVADLFRYPTLAQLAGHIASPATDHQQRLVSLAPSTQTRALYLLPGAGMAASAYQLLAKGLADTVEVKLFATKGLGTDEQPHLDMATMVNDYVEVLLTDQPQGPYYLAGHSFGGAVAFEMANVLSDLGHQVHVLLLDSMLDMPWAQSQGQSARQWLEPVIGQVLADDLEAVSQQLVEADLLPQGDNRQLVQNFIDVLQAQLDMANSYRCSGECQAEVSVLLAKEVSGDKHKLQNYYQQLGISQLQWLEGDHFSMLSAPYIDTLVSALTHWIAAIKP